ncbi:MAG: phasin family protein [Betaproteobacteria bacterium]|nr:phasin family protein [Betaproteobacteria bacterium]
MLTLDQVLQTQKAAAETAFGTANQLFGRIEELVTLNLSVAKETLEAANARTQEVLSAKDPQSLLAANAASLPTAGEKALAYGREVIAISQALGADLAQAYESQASKTQQQVAQLFDTASKNAPAGFEGVFAAGKSAIDASQRMAGYAQDAAQKAAGMLNTAMTQAAATVTPTAAPKAAAKRR